MVITQEERKIVRSDDFKSVSMGIRDEDMAMVMRILRSSLYSDPIGTIVREYVSNALDANKEAGREDEKVIVKVVKGNWLAGNKTTFSVQDSGTGLSPDLVQNVFCNYGASTKRGSNEYIGGFGIGAKSFFSYTNKFFVRTVFEEVEYLYCCLIDENDKGSIEELFSNPVPGTSSCTEVFAVLKNDSDIGSFGNAVQNQLCFLSANISIEGCEEFISRIEFPEVHTETDTYYLVEDNTRSNSTGKCVIGKIAYPLSGIRLSSEHESFLNGRVSYGDYGLKVVPKFAIGELPVTASRENIQYDSEGKIAKKIQDKVKEVYDEIEHKCFTAFQEVPFHEILVNSESTKNLTIPELRTSIGKPAVKRYIYKVLGNVGPISEWERLCKVFNVLFTSDNLLVVDEEVSKLRGRSYLAQAHYWHQGLGSGLIINDIPRLEFSGGDRINSSYREDVEYLRCLLSIKRDGLSTVQKKWFRNDPKFIRLFLLIHECFKLYYQRDIQVEVLNLKDYTSKYLQVEIDRLKDEAKNNRGANASYNFKVDVVGVQLNSYNHRKTYNTVFEDSVKFWEHLDKPPKRRIIFVYKNGNDGFVQKAKELYEKVIASKFTIKEGSVEYRPILVLYRKSDEEYLKNYLETSDLDYYWIESKEERQEQKLFEAFKPFIYLAAYSYLVSPLRIGGDNELRLVLPNLQFRTEIWEGNSMNHFDWIRNSFQDTRVRNRFDSLRNLLTFIVDKRDRVEVLSGQYLSPWEHLSKNTKWNDEQANAITQEAKYRFTEHILNNNPIIEKTNVNFQNLINRFNRLTNK